MKKIVAAVAAAAAFGAGAVFAFVGADLFRGAPENPNLTPCVKALDEAEEAMVASLLLLESAQEILEYGPTPGAATTAGVAAEILDQSEYIRYADECRALGRGE